MEKKTIGSFIATLRKANGMTQKELAEKCNVSDKTVSRWEREDGVPDLSVIPVIAEIFGVTCDELLRGERKSQAKPEESMEAENMSGGKSEKQRHRILTVSMNKYKNRTFVAVGISSLGLLAAMIGNLGFLRAYVGFFASVVFYLAGIICQAIFVNHAFLAVDDEEWKGEEVGVFRRKIIKLAEWVFGLNVVMLAFSLPLVALVNDTYMGLSIESWLLYGSVFGGIAMAVVCVVCHFINGSLFQKEGYFPGEKAEKKYRHNYDLARRCAVFTIVALLATMIVHNLVTAGGSEVSLAEGTEFYDYESFGEYMARPESRTYYYGDTMGVIAVEPESAVETGGKPTYYDEHGNVISEEQARTRQLHDGKGNVVYTYIQRNENVCSVRYSYSEADDDCLPITVVTYEDLWSGRMKLQTYNMLFAFLYAVEVSVALVIYFKKRN